MASSHRGLTLNVIHLRTAFKRIEYLLDMVFSDYADAAGPLSSPFAGRAGQLTLVQTDGQFSTSAGKLQIPAQSTPSWSDLFLINGPYARSAGKIGYMNYTPNDANKNSAIGWWQNPTTLSPNSSADRENGTYLNVNRCRILAYSVAPLLFIDNDFSASENLGIYTALRNIGAYHFSRRGGEYKFLWIEPISAHTTVYFGLSNYDQSGNLFLARVADLPANATYPVPQLGTRDLDLCSPGTGAGTSKIASPGSGDAFIHTADCIITAVASDITSGSNGKTRLTFRRVDDDNLFYLYMDNTSTFRLYAFVAGSPQLLGSGSINEGDSFTIICNGSSIKGYADGVLKWSVTNTNHLTSTSGICGHPDYPQEGAITNLEARTLDGAANVGSSNHPGYGLATDVLPGPVAFGSTFTHEADCVLEYTLTTLGTSAAPTRVGFRIQDSTHMFYVYASDAGNLVLYKYDGAGTPVVLATAATVLSGGERIVVVLDGDVIKVYYETTLAFTISDSSFATSTGGKVGQIIGFDGGLVSNLVSYPRDLANAPNTPGAASIKAALDLMATP